MTSTTGSGGPRKSTAPAAEPSFGCAAVQLDSSSEEEGYVSPYSCSSDDDELQQQHRSLLDELPAFSTHSLSPSGRSLSPIDMESPSPPRSSRNSTICSNTSAFETPPTGGSFVTLDEIHSRIGMTPPDSERSRSRLNLETIFEDMFLETPPKTKEHESRLGPSLLRRSMRSRVLFSATGGGSSESPQSSSPPTEMATDDGGDGPGEEEQMDS